MIFDSTNLFSDAQVLTGTAASSNVIDTGVASDLGKGTPIPLLIQVVSAITGTLTVAVQVDDNAAFSSPKTVTSAAFAATAPAGAQSAINYIPLGTDERYVRLNYTGATGGAVTAGVTKGNQTNG